MRTIEENAMQSKPKDQPRTSAQARTKRLERSMRSRVAAAFRAMASGVSAKSAYASTVTFYRSSGHAWARQLG